MYREDRLWCKQSWGQLTGKIPNTETVEDMIEKEPTEMKI